MRSGKAEMIQVESSRMDEKKKKLKQNFSKLYSWTIELQLFTFQLRDLLTF